MPNNNGKKTDAFDAPLPNNSYDYQKGIYDTSPAFNIGNNKIKNGFDNLAEEIKYKIPNGLRVLVIDGYQGIQWKDFTKKLDVHLKRKSINAEFEYFNNYMYSDEKLELMFEDFNGGDDRIFGKHFPLSIESFYDPARVIKSRINASIKRSEKSGALTIVYGNGAGLIELWDELWYIDLPKDIIQERFRENKVSNVTKDVRNFEEFYKKSYFIEWPALNRHKKNILPKINLFVDYTFENEPSFVNGEDFRSAIEKIAHSPFRVTPWFFPGPWGGQYMKNHMGLDKEQQNFAWSFELISPENGITLQSDDYILEFSFDCLMYQNNREVLGKASKQFIYEWPIRFDYLDTIDGGNLSTQVHPRPDYIKKEFGETFTQDETYYIVNSKPGAKVYLGLKEDCDLKEFKKDLEKSVTDEREIDIDKFLHFQETKPHDLFFIPNGTVHCSGKDNLVLEISATPYIFTFKIYDYLRRDLEGNLRPINIQRGFDNIRSERREEYVKDNLVAKPVLSEEGSNWKLYELYNKPFTFYKIYRLEFSGEYELNTNGFAYTVNLVGGEEVEIISKNGVKQKLSYLETMLIPEAAENVKIINNSGEEYKMVLVHVKEEAGFTESINSPND